MKKQKIQLLILVLGLALLGGGYLGLQKYNEAQNNKAEEVQEINLLALEAEDIIRIAYDYEGNHYSYEKTEDTWYYTEDRELSLTQSSFALLTMRLAELAVETVISDVTDMEQYGLTEPYRIFTFATAEEEYEFYIGDRNDITYDYYICRPGENTVYLVESALISYLNKSVDDLVEETEEETVES